MTGDCPSFRAGVNGTVPFSLDESRPSIPCRQPGGDPRSCIAQADQRDLHWPAPCRCPWPNDLSYSFEARGQRPRQASPTRKMAVRVMPAAVDPAGHVGQRAANDLLIRPRGVIDHRRRTLRPIILRQRRRRLGDLVGREKDAHRGPRLRPGAKAPRPAASASARPCG